MVNNRAVKLTRHFRHARLLRSTASASDAGQVALADVAPDTHNDGPGPLTSSSTRYHDSERTMALAAAATLLFAGPAIHAQPGRLPAATRLPSETMPVHSRPP